MDLRARFKKISHFLREHQDIWMTETLYRPSQNLCLWATEAREHLKTYSIEELSEFENNFALKENAPNNFFDIVQQLKELMSIPALPIKKNDFTSKKPRGMTPKKQHEITQLGQYLSLEKDQLIHDIGGGVGHLSLYLAQRFEIKSLIFEKDPLLIQRGQYFLQKYYPKQKHQLTWAQATLGKQFWPIDKSAFTLGLHSCGSLSVELLKNAKKGLNVGCCFHLLQNEFNLSQLAQENPLHLSSHALHLAAKGYNQATTSDLVKRKNIKHHRYLLHFFLEQYVPDKTQISFGSSPQHHYLLPFSDYLQLQLNQQNISCDLKLIDIQTFVAKNLDRFQQYFYQDFVRSIFSRVLEIYLVLDRAIWLQEKGVKTELFEIFERSISPRNLAIYFDSSHLND